MAWALGAWSTFRSILLVLCSAAGTASPSFGPLVTIASNAPTTACRMPSKGPSRRHDASRALRRLPANGVFPIFAGGGEGGAGAGVQRAKPERLLITTLREGGVRDDGRCGEKVRTGSARKDMMGPTPGRRHIYIYMGRCSEPNQREAAEKDTSLFCCSG